MSPAFSFCQLYLSSYPTPSVCYHHAHMAFLVKEWLSLGIASVLQAALEFLLVTGRQPDILHCHDWSTAGVAQVLSRY